MKEFRNWLEREESRSSKIVGLEDALLGSAMTRYLWYRLRYLVFRNGLFSLTRLLEVYLLYSFTQVKSFSVFILLLLLSWILQGWVWGSLEELRDFIRTKSRSGDIPAIAKASRGQFLDSLRSSSVLFLLGAAAIIAWMLNGAGSFELAIASVYLIRSCLSIVLFTQHAAVYAVRRVYRPALFIFGPDLLGFGIMLGGHFFMGIWIFPIVLLITSLATFAINIYYCESLRALLAWPSIFKPQPKDNRKTDVKMLLQAGLAGLVMQFDALLIVIAALMLGAGEGFDGQSLAAILFLISPQVRAAHDWANIFYFDLKKLELEEFRNFRARFEQITFLLSLVLALVAASLSSLILLIFGISLGPEDTLALYVFFFARAGLSILQVQFFTLRRYVHLITAGALLLGVSIFGFSLLQNTQGSLLAIALGSLISSLFLLLSRRHFPASDNHLQPSALFHKIQRSEEQQSLITIQFDFKLLSLDDESIQSELISFGRKAYESENFYFSTIASFGAVFSGTSKVSDGEIFAMLPASLAQGVKELWTSSNSREDIKRLRESILGKHIVTSEVQEPSREELIGQFRSDFETSLVVNFSGSHLERLLPAKGSRDLTRGCLGAAARFARTLSPQLLQGNRIVAALCNSDSIEAVLVAQTRKRDKGEKERIRKWFETFRRYNLRPD